MKLRNLNFQSQTSLEILDKEELGLWALRSEYIIQSIK